MLKLALKAKEKAQVKSANNSSGSQGNNNTNSSNNQEKDTTTDTTTNTKDEVDSTNTTVKKKPGRTHYVKVDSEYDVSEWAKERKAYNIKSADEVKQSTSDVQMFFDARLQEGMEPTSAIDAYCSAYSKKAGDKGWGSLSNKLGAILRCKFLRVPDKFKPEINLLWVNIESNRKMCKKKLGAHRKDNKSVEYEVLLYTVNELTGEWQVLAWLLLATGGRAANLIVLHGSQLHMLENGLLVEYRILKANKMGDTIIAFYKYEWTMEPPKEVKEFLEKRKKDHPHEPILMKTNAQGSGPWSCSQMATTYSKHVKENVLSKKDATTKGVITISVKDYRRHMDKVLRMAEIPEKEFVALMNHSMKTSDSHYSGTAVALFKARRDFPAEAKKMTGSQVKAMANKNMEFPHDGKADMSFSDDEFEDAADASLSEDEEPAAKVAKK